MKNNLILPSLESAKIAVVGLGYVGLPLAVEFGKIHPVLGFDINKSRIEKLKNGHDTTLEISDAELANATKLEFSLDPTKLTSCNVFIITVPTPIDKYKRPNLSPLMNASELIGNVLKKGDVVIYESTVYPGATEEDCVPILEVSSGLVYNTDFFVGYSPERINPGDKQHRLPDIVKVTSGSTVEVGVFVDQLYRKIIKVGTHLASSIRVAEAAKVIENTQRDLNIALINELAIIFNKMGIDTLDVLEAAGTKWNFLPFRPGLVGGHCIGVDPYYLTHKAEEIGHRPEVILSGRRMNDGMGIYLASQMIKLMLKKGMRIPGSRILMMGLSFKENCPDLRNTKVVDIITELKDYGIIVDIYDPWVNVKEAKAEYGYDLIKIPETGVYSGIFLSVMHNDFVDLGIQKIREFGKENALLFDIKGIFSAIESDFRL